MEGITSPPMPGTIKGAFSPLLISMLGIIFTTTAIILYHFFLVRYCMRRHAATTTAARTTPTPTATGVDDKILRTIPILAFSSAKRRTADIQDDCAVCLGELEDQDAVRLLPNCNHAFHVACIDEWFSKHTSCPLCRSPVEPNTTPCVATHSANDSDREATSNNSGDQSESSSTVQVQSSGLLRHCVSLALPPQPAAAERTPARLKRSLSMDQCLVINNNVQSSDHHNCSSSTFDRVSSKFIRSFSWLRLGKGSDAPILPY
ncbi:hypothetical protein BUALT_Bualt09G0083700 [Buddleja alternifolia]|uniref:RING-type E3 ubiquitin transferase n=1 Tax=Buddleja alternifolia TaxID=168488 RepID=A0AAV6X270_9LAMI|nr:hypothetical protein BUALT_Bualt09G0083700 [Buddleja alternifolia]